MRRFQWLSFAAVALCATTAIAQAPADSGDVPTGTTDITAHLSENMTPEMWLYIQETRRHNDPKEAVRRKAQLRSDQRQRRLESQRWFGFMNLRPPANPIPYYGTYSPSWMGSNRNGYAWYGVGHPYVTYHTGSRR